MLIANKALATNELLIANKLLTINEIGGIKGGDKLIEKCGKLLKTGKMIKGQKLFKLENCNVVAT